MNTELLERAPVEDEQADETEAALVPHEAEPVEDAQEEAADGFVDMPLKEGYTRGERRRLLDNPRTKKILYNSVMLLTTLANQIALQADVDAIKDLDPPAVAQMQAADQVDQENLPDSVVGEAKGEETPLTEEDILAQQVSRYPWRLEAAEAHHKLEEGSLITLDVNQEQGEDQEDQEQAA